jgi:hypothetical protein
MFIRRRSSFIFGTKIGKGERNNEGDFRKIPRKKE